MPKCCLLKLSLVIIFVCSISLIISVNALSEKITVEQGESIQEAIDQASSGDIIEVESGDYEEYIVINKPLVITGLDTGKGIPSIERASLLADRSELSNFKVRSGDFFGITVNSNFSVVSNNDVQGCMAGIFLNKVHSNLIQNNSVLVACDGLYGLLSGSFSKDGGDGIQLTNCYNNTIRDNAIENGYIGIYLDTSSGNLVEGNRVKGSTNGIGLFSAVGNDIVDNTVQKVSTQGIGLLKFSNDSIIKGNTVEDSGEIGIYLKDSSDNTIYLNKFQNRKNAQSKDVRSHGSFSLWHSLESITFQEGNKTIKGYVGNYWSDYRGKDLNGDGIGDNPYVFDGGQDEYPLIFIN